MIPGTIPMFSAGGGPSDFEFFTASGTFNVPATVSEVWVFLAGGGGGGGGVIMGGTDQGVGTSGPGGYGGLSVGYVSVTSGSSISVTVGAGGNGSNGNYPGYNGGTSNFGAYMSATGGQGGGDRTNPYTGASGTGSGGSILNSNISTGSWATVINNMLANWAGDVDYSDINVLKNDSTTSYNASLYAQQWTTAQTVYRPGTRGLGTTGYTSFGRGGFEGVCLVAWNV